MFGAMAYPSLVKDLGPLYLKWLKEELSLDLYLKLITADDKKNMFQ